MAALDMAKYILGQLAEHPDELEITENGAEITVTAAKADMGRIIGRQGRTAKAIRTVVRATVHDGGRCFVEFKEKGGVETVAAEPKAETT